MENSTEISAPTVFGLRKTQFISRGKTMDGGAAEAAQCWGTTRRSFRLLGAVFAMPPEIVMLDIRRSCE